MIVFIVLTAVAILLTSRSVVNLFRDRFPHPIDVATISIFYYGVPLAVAGYFDLNYDHMVFLANFAADQGLAEFSIRFIVLAIAALQLGKFLAVRLGSPKLTRFSTINTLALERLRFAFVGLIGLIVAGVYLFGLREFLAGYATEGLDATGATGNAVVYATLEFMGIAIAFAIILGLRTGRVPFKVLIAACLAIMVAIFLIRAKRLEIVSAFIPIAVVLLSRRSTVSSTSWRVVAGLLVVLALVVVSAVRASVDLSFGQGIFLFFSEGLYAGHSLPGITERLETQTLTYEYGARFVSALLGFVPRFVWEGKDAMVYIGNLALKGVAPLGATSLLAEVVLQGGLIAVAVCYMAMGFIFERIMRFQDVWDQSLDAGVIPGRCGAYLIAIAIFIPHFRDGIIPAIKLSLQAGILFALLSGMRIFGKSKVRVSAEPDAADDKPYRDGGAALP